MTLIVAGKLDNNPFLMVDCVGKQEDKFTFINKLTKFRSAKDTFYTLCGSDRFMYAISIYDEKIFLENKVINFNDDSFLNEVLEIYQLLIKRPEIKGSGNSEEINRIYVLNKDSIHFYDINFDEDDKIKDRVVTHIKNNYIVLPISPINPPEEIKNINDILPDIYQYCTSRIIAANRNNNGITLKNRFSFIHFADNNVDLRLPTKNNYEIVLGFVGAEYCEI
jgi:hypothetical protein